MENWKNRRIYSEIESLKDLYKKVVLKVENENEKIIELENPMINKNQEKIPKYLHITIKKEYPFICPKISINKSKKNYQNELMATNLPRVLKYLREYNIPIEDFICDNSLENTWSPCQRIEKMIYYLEHINKIKQNIKYAITLGEKIPDDIGRYIISFIL